MAFPQLENPEWDGSEPGPYERRMGDFIRQILEALAPLVPDAESCAMVLALSAQPTRWGAAHAVFDEVRRRRLRAADELAEAQYFFEECCAKALYNATRPIAAFDPSSPFYVVPSAITLTHALGFSDSQTMTLIKPDQPW